MIGGVIWRKKVPDMAKSGFTSAWLPPATHSFSPEGYLPQNLYSLDSEYGSERLLRALLQKMMYKVRAMADIVINHRVGTTQGHGGMYNRCDGIPLAWDEHAVTSCTGGKIVTDSGYLIGLTAQGSSRLPLTSQQRAFFRNFAPLRLLRGNFGGCVILKGSPLGFWDGGLLELSLSLITTTLARLRHIGPFPQTT